jgi:hypothetical protein
VIGISDTAIAPPTMPIGRSRSVRSTVPPARRARLDTAAARIPRMIGPRIFSSVQTAATAIAPAPTNRTSVPNVVDTTSETSAPSGRSPQVSVGSRIA